MAHESRTVTAGIDPDREPAARGLGALFAGLVAVCLWASAVAAAAGAVASRIGGVPDGVLLASALASVVGLVLGAVVYARHRGIDLGLAIPPRTMWPTAAAVIAAPGLLAVGVAVAGNALADVTLSATTQRWIAGDAAVGVLLRTAVAPAAFAALGYGVLFCGVVYERARALVGPDRAVAVSTALVGFFWLLPVDPVVGLPPTAGGAGELLLSTLFGVAFGTALGVLAGRPSGDATRDLAPHHWAVLLVAGVGVVGVATDLAPLVPAVGDLLRVAALGVALVGYARTRSVWVPVLSLAVFQVAVVAVIYLEAGAGLAVA